MVGDESPEFPSFNDDKEFDEEVEQAKGAIKASDGLISHYHPIYRN